MERFFAKIASGAPAECWPWTSGTSKGGYGHWTWWEGGKSRSTTAHRKAWELANGPIPRGMVVLHRCDNPPCCNPAHLWLGTHQDNMDDKVAKGRQWRGGRPIQTHCGKGHLFNPATEMMIKVRGKMVRTCRTCHNARSLATYHASKRD